MTHVGPHKEEVRRLNSETLSEAPPQTLVARFAELAQAAPDRPAITCGADTITRIELDRRTNRLARAYQELGVTKDSFVTIGLPNSIEFLAAAIAAWKCGATPQPISSRLPGRETAAIIALAEPTLVVGISEQDAPGFTVVPPGFEPSADLSDSAFDMGAAASLKAPTSGGSTGRPKLIVAGDRAEADNLTPFARVQGMQDDDTILITGPLYHNAPFTLSFCGLSLGGHIVLMPRFDAAESLRLIETYDVTWMYAVPTMMNRIWRLPESERTSYDVSSLRNVMHMAAPCPAWLKHAWIDWLGAEAVLELYAGTEVQSVTVVNGVEWLAHPGTVGRPVVGEMIVLGPDGSPLPAGEVGEIWMRRGEGQAAPYRYIGAEAQTIGDGWETVGDMGSMDAEGYLYLADRKSDMIVVGGANVYPAEVEAALLEHPQVSSAVVIGLEHEDLGHVPHALVQLETPLTDDDLRDHLAEHLARYKIPRSFERVTEPLRDDAGKVRRAALVAARKKPT
ncbi:bile acid-coenzyme A ligase [Antricoccus suffuscus]|uniref:Bile acid-coenzyme A ligase n=1 Tax=Antricoccus suffuscus TaxID=1629062 RepID=A0A2T1A225_9ACTN|nr:AMP-binding protein [Antricoccus suffuscus]PRZ42661.1 bile acid-coenzyme A ligase [Antricoccus suffuscus]